MSALTDIRSLGYLGIVVGLAAAYFVAGKLGLMVAIVNPSASAVWPPTGIALAALLLLGNRVWPAIFVGAFVVNVTTAGTVATSIGIASGNTLEALLGAYLVNRFANGRNVFDNPHDILKAAILAGGLSTTVSATIGVSSLALGGFAAWNDFGSVWLTWWLGDAVGDLIVAPLIVLWSLNPRIDWKQGETLKALVLLLVVAVMGLLIFGGFLPATVSNEPLTFLALPLLVWTAFRFGQREAVSANFLLSLIAVTGTLRGVGPFTGESQNESLVLLQAFMGVIAVTTISLATVVSERKRLEAQLRHLAEHDPLTSLVSRSRFQEELARELTAARRYGFQVAVLFIDMDDFKHVNDSLGHGVGDKLLASVARLIVRRLRDSDLVARVGGDEFVILLSHVDLRRAQAVAKQLVAAIGNHSIKVKKYAVRTTASIGIAIFPDHGATDAELLNHADAAMYEAKAAGRKRYCVYGVHRALRSAK
jgi:diguanylate cyclase (GGDEF)-like protein